MAGAQGHPSEPDAVPVDRETHAFPLTGDPKTRPTHLERERGQC